MKINVWAKCLDFIAVNGFYRKMSLASISGQMTEIIIKANEHNAPFQKYAGKTSEELDIIKLSERGTKGMNKGLADRLGIQT
jgi:hypothetical protein